jgi:hypothetical protein
MKTKLPELTGDLDARMRIQRQRNAIMFERNAKQLGKNERFLRRFGWIPLLCSELRYQNEELIRVDANLHKVDRDLEREIARRPLSQEDAT